MDIHYYLTESPSLHTFAMHLPKALRKLCCRALWKARDSAHADHRHSFSPYTDTKFGVKGVFLCEWLEWRARDFESWADLPGYLDDNTGEIT